MRPDELALVHLWLGRDLGEAIRPASASSGGWEGRAAPPARECVAAFLCRIGQPVWLGHGPDGPFGALRLALSAAQLREEDDGATLSLVFAKLALVLDHFAALPRPDRSAPEMTPECPRPVPRHVHGARGLRRAGRAACSARGA